MVRNTIKHLRSSAPQEKAVATSEEIVPEIIAETLVAISEGIKRLRDGPLNEKALLLLIQHAIPQKERVSTNQIKAVLDGAENLKTRYLKR